MSEAAGIGRPATSSRASTPPLLFGTIVFLASELLFFGGLFAAYFTLRSSTAVWPPARDEISATEPAIATVLLVASSFTFIRAVRLLAARDRRGFHRWTILTFVLGAAFLLMQLHDYLQLSFRVSTDAYGTMFYAMTGFHGLHVLVGLLLMLVILGRSRQGAYDEGVTLGPEAVGYYWHFVDVVWVALFGTIYLLR
jgi:cytochrome c oxidase subunit III